MEEIIKEGEKVRNKEIKTERRKTNRERHANRIILMKKKHTTSTKPSNTTGDTKEHSKTGRTNKRIMETQKGRKKSEGNNFSMKNKQRNEPKETRERTERTGKNVNIPSIVRF